MDTDRKCEFNRITHEETTMYNIAATINDKKARDKVFKGPLEQRTVPETIELDNYNRKYGDRKQKYKKQRRVSSGSSSNGEQVAITSPARKQKPIDTDEKTSSTQNCHFCGKSNWIPELSLPARKSQCNICKKTGHFATVCESKTVNLIP